MIQATITPPRKVGAGKPAPCELWTSSWGNDLLIHVQGEDGRKQRVVLSADHALILARHLIWLAERRSAGEQQGRQETNDHR